MARHTILIDADDTLWENNIFFEKAIDDFISSLEHLGYTREYIRHILNETERRNIRQHGYGVRSFRRSLEDTYLKLAGNAARREIIQEIERTARELESTPPHILDGVPETLAYLAKHHRLILLTKGEAAEQAGKVERSGLQSYFDAIEIVIEKDSGTYDRMIGQFKIVKSHGWAGWLATAPAATSTPLCKWASTLFSFRTPPHGNSRKPSSKAAPESC
jgi:putative hydrolase of the HAD superfamily